MIDEELLHLFDKLDETSYLEPQYNQLLSEINNFLTDKEVFYTQVKACIDEFETDDEDYLYLIIEALFYDYENHKEDLEYILSLIFESSLNTTDDYNLLYLAIDFDIEEHNDFANNVFKIAIKYAYKDNFYVQSASAYLITSSFHYLSNENKARCYSLFQELINSSNWKIRYMCYSYLKENKIENYNISFIDKIKGTVIKVSLL